MRKEEYNRIIKKEWRNHRIVIRTIDNAEKWHGLTAFYKIWSYCAICDEKFAQEFFGTLPTRELADVCNECCSDYDLPPHI